MIDRAHTEAGNAAALERLLGLGLALAEHMQAGALAAETAQEAQARTMAFARAARSVRQTVALRDRLVRSAEAAERLARAEAGKQAQARAERRKAEAKGIVTRAIWTEREAPEAERLVETLAELLDEAEAAGEFGDDAPFDACLARIMAELGVELPAAAIESAHPREGGDPSGVAGPHPSASPTSAWIPAGVYPRADLRSDPGAGTSGEGGGPAGTTGGGEAASRPADGSPWAGTWPDTS